MTGMLWFDPGSDPLPVKVRKAADYYHRKYGSNPTVVFLNPADLQAGDQVQGVELKPSKSIQKNHLWLGIETGR